MHKLLKLSSGETYLIDDIAQTHIEIFEGYFLSNLGVKFLRKYYMAFALDPQSDIFVAKQNKEISSFIVVSKDPQRVIKYLVKKNLFWLGVIFLKKFFLLDFGFFFDVIKKAKNQLANIFSKKNTSARGDGHVRLLSIATKPSSRGSGITSQLMNFSISYLHSSEFKSLGLSVFSDNTKAISFYTKHEFYLEKKKGNMSYFVKKIHETK